MEAIAVTAAGGTLRTLLEKLGSILTQEILLLYGVREEILFLRDELESMNVFLQKLSMMGDDLDSQVRIWMKQVRELAYDAEDCIDQFMHHLGKVSGGGLAGNLHRYYLVLKKLIKRHEIAVRIENLKNIAHDVSLRRSRYNVDASTQTAVAAASAVVVPFDPQHHALTEQTQLKGTYGSNNLLVGWLTDKSVSELRVVSLYGFGGLGKTALAMKAYTSPEITSDPKITSDPTITSPQIRKCKFDCYALVPVSQKFNIKIILESILKQVANKNLENPSTIELMHELQEYLKEMKYIIFLDDIWSAAAWNSIKDALPNNNKQSRIIVTTRIESVASACSSRPNDRRLKIYPLNAKFSKELLFERVFGPGYECPPNLVEVSEKILKKCAGHPLAIISVADLLVVRSTEAQTDQEQWKKAYDSLGSELVTNPILERIKKVLTLSYSNLPHHLKTCFLYLSTFPEGHSITRTVLIRKWIAEGFISNRRGLSVEEIAESFFDEFIDRSMLQQEIIETNGKVKTCSIHGLLHDLIVSKSSEENFVYLLNDENISVPHDRVRRLSLNITDKKHMNQSLSLFQLRTLTIFGQTGNLVATFSLKCLRVLDLSGCKDLKAYHLKSIHNLFLLKYLNLRNTMIQQLPKQIERLEYLETLDIRGTGVKKLPKGIVKLQNLMHLLFSKNLKAPIMPHKIGKMRALRTLANVSLSKSLFDMNGLGCLSQLTKLGVIARTNEAGYYAGLIYVIGKLSTPLRSLTIIAEQEPRLLEWLNKISPTPLFLSSLHLGGNIKTLPAWVSHLDNLVKAKFINTMLRKDVIEVLKSLPNLRCLTLLYMSYSDSELRFEDGFRSLEFLAISFCNVRSLCFDKCSTPKLQMIALSHLQLEDPNLSIEHLDCLKEIFFRGITTNAFQKILLSIQKEARLHPNVPKVVVEN